MRQDRLLKTSSSLICYYPAGSSGISCVDTYADTLGLEVINLASPERNIICKRRPKKTASTDINPSMPNGET